MRKQYFLFILFILFTAIENYGLIFFNKKIFIKIREKFFSFENSLYICISKIR